MTKAKFTDSTTIHVVAKDGETFVLRTHLSIKIEEQKIYSKLLARYFDENFSDDKSSMVYWVLMKMMSNHGLSFYYESSDRSKERERIGLRIKQMREMLNMEAKHLALLTNIDAANISRIEQGRYSVGFDILSKIALAVGARIDLVK
jgi:DNA-binding XRE family transcriptional regulator